MRPGAAKVLLLLAGCAPALRAPRQAPARPGGAGEVDPALLLAEVQATIRRSEGEPDSRERRALAARAV